MSDFFAEHAQFIAVPTDERQQQQQQRRRQWLDGRTVVLITFILVPIIVCCGVYMLIVGTNGRLVYPKCCNPHVPSLWIYRANVYNNYTNYTIINQKIDDNYNDIYSNYRKYQQYDDDDNDFKLVCYYNFPNIENFRELLPYEIDPYLCTHINVGFATIQTNQIYLNQQQLEILSDLLKLKQINGNLKILLSIGGAGNDYGFNDMVLNHTNRKLFIHSIVNYVKLYKIDGIDIDWEFPNRLPNHDNRQRLHFTQLLEEIRITINKQHKHKFLLTIAGGAPDFIIDMSYDVPYINQFVDFVNLMSYDYHFYTKLTPFTGHNSPLYPSIDDNGYFFNLNINHTVNYWLLKGLERKKLIIGLPTYGHSYRLLNINNNGLYAPCKNYGKLGYNGFFDYGQLCKFLEINQIKPTFDLDAKTPYATKSLEWVSFDNEQSLSFKAEFIRDHHFGGAMIYSLNTDDHKGICRFDRHIPIETFPLTKKVHEILNANYSLF